MSANNNCLIVLLLGDVDFEPCDDTSIEDRERDSDGFFAVGNNENEEKIDDAEMRHSH